jgi:hypothetical protein
MTFKQYLYLKEATSAPITFGDLKQAIKKAANQKMAGKLVGSAVKGAIKTGFNAVIGQGQSQGQSQIDPLDAIEAAGDAAQAVAARYLDPTGPILATFKKFMKVVDNLRGNNILSKIDIDDEAADIVADNVEDSFIFYMIKTLNNFPDNQVIPPGWSMTKELIRYLSNTYKGRTLSVPGDLKTSPSAPATPLPPEFS